MSLRRALLGVTLAFGLAATLVPGTAMASGGGTLMVDNDGHASPGHCGSSHHAESNIQDAVLAADPGDTILVCPGTYAEQVLILNTHGLTVRSTKPWGAIIKPAPGPVPGGYMVGIGYSNHITFDGFKLNVPTTGDCAPVGTAILLIGTKSTIVRGNQIRATGPQTLGACGYAVGVAVGPDFASPTATALGVADAPTDATRATVIFNSVRDFQFAGIAASGEGSVATIARNSIRYFHTNHTSGDQCLTAGASVTAAGSDVRSRLAKLARLRSVAAASISDASPLSCVGFGIITGMGARSAIVDNEIHSGPDSLPELAPLDATTTPILLGGIVDLYDEGLPFSRISGNHVFRTVAGIAVVYAQYAVVKGNRVTTNVLGMYFDSVDRLTVRDNRAKGNAVGIAMLDALFHAFASNANQFRGNNAHGNLEASCVDQTNDADTPFGGDLGTDNRWRDNTAERDSSSPAGICGAPTPH